MANIADYLHLIKLGKISKLGQRCENGEGYYCMIIENGKLIPSIVKIEGCNVNIFPIKRAETEQERQK